MDGPYQIDDATVRHALAGDAEAFADLVEASEDDLRAFLRERNVPACDLEDVVNETYMRAWSWRKDLDASIIRREIHRVASRVLRSREAAAKRSSIARRLFGWWRSECSSIEQATDLDHMLRHLPGDAADAVRLKYVMGLAVSDVARSMGVAETRVQHLLRTARGLLRAQSEAEGWRIHRR